MTMGSSKKEDLSRLFPTRRISNLNNLIVVLVYFPIGTVLTIARVCLSLNYICAHIALKCFFSNDHHIFFIIDQVFSLLLGCVVSCHGQAKGHTRIIISNQRSNIDGLILSKVLRRYSEDKWNLSSFWRNVFNLKSQNEIADIAQSVDDKKVSPIILFPENSPSSGSALLSFDKKYFLTPSRVQIAAVKPKRILPILLATANSSWWQDLLWTFFCPITIYNVTFGDVLSKSPSETNEVFCDKVEENLADLLNIPFSKVTVSDKKEYVKNLQLYKNQSSKYGGKIPPKFVQMAKQVKEIVPHVPNQVIIKDLQVTNSVDRTVTNILEGIVKFDTVEKSNKPVHKDTSTSINRHSSMQEKKLQFYSQARRRYIEKHGS